MLHSVYCKINEYRANFSLLGPFLITQSIQNRTDPFVLQRHFGEAYPIVSEHLQCLPKALKKLPTMASAGCLFANIPYEQSTSERVADFHATLAEKVKILSITGGLGSDDVAFARAGATVLSLDPDPGLNALLAYNLELLGLQNITRLTTTAESFLEGNKATFDLVFADPDRRPDGQKKHGNASEYSPDVFALIAQYPTLAKRWLLKLSPLSDISWLQHQISGQMDIYVVTEQGEVKEVLCDISSEATGKTWLQQVEGDTIIAWNGQEVITSKVEFPVFMEASPGAIKCGFHRGLSSIFPLQTRNENSTYFTGNLLFPNYVGRCFALKDTLTGSLSSIKSELQKQGITQANVSSRNFVLGTEALREKLSLKDGGNTYLFFTGKQEKTCFLCTKI